jgi:Holliday junction resolvasome RuvABC endonuclease subunit
MGIPSADLFGKKRTGKSRTRKAAQPCRVPFLPLDGTILAFDPSIANLGWGAFFPAREGPIRLDSGCWSPESRKSSVDRFQQLAEFVANKIEYHEPKYIVIELPNRKGMGRGAMWSQKNVITYGRAVGVIEGVCRAMRPDSIYTPDVEAWKGTESKSGTALEVKHVLGYETADDNESDALGMCLWLIRAAIDRPF